MAMKRIRIRLTGDIADTTAASLGGRIERSDRIEFVSDNLDQSQLTGLLVQLDDLHIGYEGVEVDDTGNAGESPSCRDGITITDESNETSR